MKRFISFLVVMGIVAAAGLPRAQAQVIADEPPAAEAPQAKTQASYHEAMCNRMCVQLGNNKKTEVCGKVGKKLKTYDNACAAKCAKVRYKRGACPEEKKEEAPAVVALDEDAVLAQFEAEDKRPGGEVKWFDWDKGYGAIVGDDGKELYVDASAVTGDAVETLKQGDRVKFDVSSGPKGLHAAKVALELSDEQKDAKLEQASLQVVEEQKPQTAAAPKQMLREAPSNDDGVYIMPTR